MLLLLIMQKICRPKNSHLMKLLPTTYKAIYRWFLTAISTFNDFWQTLRPARLSYLTSYKTHISL